MTIVKNAIIQGEFDPPASSPLKMHTTTATYPLNANVTVLGVFPHMHLIGKSITSFAVNGNDTVPMIHIPQCDFQWQFSYDTTLSLSI